MRKVKFRNEASAGIAAVEAQIAADYDGEECAVVEVAADGTETEKARKKPKAKKAT